MEKQFINDIIDWMKLHESFSDDMDKISNWAGINISLALPHIIEELFIKDSELFLKVSYQKLLNEIIKIESTATYQSGPSQKFRILHKGKDKAPWRS